MRAQPLRLGLAVSAASFCAMLFAGFAGLAQLGLFAVVGLVVAAAVTRWVLPAVPVRAAEPSGVDRACLLARRRQTTLTTDDSRARRRA